MNNIRNNNRNGLNKNFNNVKPERVYLSFDVEADGPAPGLYSMISFALVDVLTKDIFKVELSPISDFYIPEALAVSGFSREETLKFEDPETQMKKMLDWVNEKYPNKRLCLISDNPAFDWQFINYYCIKYLGKNPFGHSARRIGDVWAGYQNNFSNDSSWKKMRTTKHTHDPADDALGNAEAFNEIMKLMKNKRSPRF